MQNIEQFFPDLNDRQREQLAALDTLYREWNGKINVVSRKDIDQLYLHHVLHSLAIAKVIQFKPGARLLDLGTGGGFPGIPLAILFPQAHFTLVDGTRKKITVVTAVAEALGLTNVTAMAVRAEELKGRQFDFIISRAVAPLRQLCDWSFKLIADKQRHAMPNGLLALKGGDIQAEIRELPKGSYTEYWPISRFFGDPYFEEKYVVYVQY
jgi:16S rRNA (guanine527-N7)-methyltransferase